METRHQVDLLIERVSVRVRPEVTDPKSASTHRLVPFRREALIGRQYPQRLAYGIHIGGMRVRGRRITDHLVRGVVRPPQRPPFGRKPIGVGQRDQSEVTNEPRSAPLVQVAGLDISVRDIEVALQPPQGVSNRGNSFDHVTERTPAQSFVNWYRNRHGEPRLVLLR